MPPTDGAADSGVIVPAAGHRSSGIVTTDAVVLRSVKYGDTSRILTLYTRGCGRVSGMLRGATRPGRRSLSALEPTARVTVVLHVKPGREVQTISQCDPGTGQADRSRAQWSLERIGAAMQSVELVTGVTHTGEENAVLFERLTRCLDRIYHSGDTGHPGDPGSTLDPAAELLAFAVDLCGILGFALNFHACAVCGRPLPPQTDPLRPVRFSTTGGGPLCASCTPPEGPVAKLSGAEISILAGAGFPAVENGIVKEGVAGVTKDVRKMETDHLFELIVDYLRYHIPGFRGLRTSAVFRSVGAGKEPAGPERLLKHPGAGRV